MTRINAGADIEGELPGNVADSFLFEDGFVERPDPFSSRPEGASPGLSCDWPKNPGAGAEIVLA
jgi:hypothetical protein